MQSQSTPIRDMDHAELVAAMCERNPFSQGVYESGDDQTLRRTLVRYRSGPMTNQQADEVLAAEGGES